MGADQCCSLNHVSYILYLWPIFAHLFCRLMINDCTCVTNCGCLDITPVPVILFLALSFSDIHQEFFGKVSNMMFKYCLDLYMIFFLNNDI